MTPSMTTSEPHGTGRPCSGDFAIGAGSPRRAPASSYSFWSYSLGVEGDGNWQVVADLFGLAQVLGDVVHRHRLQRKFPRALDLDAVDADILLAGVLRILGVLGHHRGFVKVEPAVAVVEPDERKHFEDVDVLTDLGVLRPWRSVPPHPFHRGVRPPGDETVDPPPPAAVS